MTNVVQHPVTQDMPLPGHYPCLTLQLNVTRYQATGLQRWVLVVREPSVGLELTRTSQDVSPDANEARQDLVVAIEQALANMRWMQLGEEH